MRERELAAWLSSYRGRPLRLMEICGTHTSALYRTGIRQILPEGISLVSGPGCPVCVTPTSYIDRLVEISRAPGHRVLAFGDLLAVPGSRMSLAGAKAQGGAVDFLYNPEDAIEMAKAFPSDIFVLAAVGFETTVPVWASLAHRVHEEHISNVRFLSALKTMPQAILKIAAEKRIDGFLCPGHVAVVTGASLFRKLAEISGETMVIGGFSAPELLRALSRLVLEASRGHAGLWNEYPSVVTEAGNTRAKALISEVFTPGDAVWRGLGEIAGSGLYFSPEYEYLDMGSRGLSEDRMPPGCRCDAVLTGKIGPRQCPCFGRACTPEHPVGACMVSSEGACCVNYREM